MWFATMFSCSVGFIFIFWILLLNTKVQNFEVHFIVSSVAYVIHLFFTNIFESLYWSKTQSWVKIPFLPSIRIRFLHGENRHVSRYIEESYFQIDSSLASFRTLFKCLPQRHLYWPADLKSTSYYCLLTLLLNGLLSSLDLISLSPECKKHLQQHLVHSRWPISTGKKNRYYYHR